MDSWFREIYVLRAWRVYLATGFDFREKKRVCFASIGVRVCLLSPTLPLYYEGKVKKTILPQTFVYVLRTTRTRHMVSFSDLYFHFLANFQTLTSPHTFSIWVLSITPKIPVTSVGIQMERTVSVSFNRNIRDHLWRWFTYFGRNISTEIYRSLPLLGISEEEFEMTRAISIGCPSLIGKCRSILLRFSH